MVNLIKLAPQPYVLMTAREIMEQRDRMLKLALSRGMFVLENCTNAQLPVNGNDVPSEFRLIKVKLQRIVHNLNFMIVCDACHGPHSIDELVAPER